MMRLQRSTFWVLFFVIIVTSSHVVSCRFIRTSNQGNPVLPLTELQRLRSRSSSFEDLNNKKIDITPAYTVSKKVVPGGPNPLHN